LILGGTTEAAELAHRVVDDFGERVEVISSLAGRLKPTRTLPGETRVGGFGGTSGITEYLNAEKIDWVVDATHPFARNISDHAAAACARAGVPELVVARPPWKPAPGDRWLEVDGFKQAADVLPRVAARVFLTTGPGMVQAFAGMSGVWFLVRMFQPPVGVLPLTRYLIVTARPPFTVERERALFREHRIDTLVTKQSGGPTDAKLIAARETGAKVVMIRRPPPPPDVPRVETVDQALAWIGERVNRRGAQHLGRRT
jgi:precorrin-6A/cobalt-precorrin-6A reductase